MRSPASAAWRLSRALLLLVPAALLAAGCAAPGAAPSGDSGSGPRTVSIGVADAGESSIVQAAQWIGNTLARKVLRR